MNSKSFVHPSPFPPSLTECRALPSSSQSPHFSVPKRTIKRPPNGYIVYRSWLLKSGMVSTSQQQIFSKVAGRLWQSMSKEEKEPWMALGREKGKKHAQDNPGYKYQPGKKKNKRTYKAKRAVVTETEVADMVESVIAQGPLFDTSHVRHNSIASGSGSQAFNQLCFASVTDPTGHDFSLSTYPPMAWTAGSSMAPAPWPAVEPFYPPMAWTAGSSMAPAPWPAASVEPLYQPGMPYRDLLPAVAAPAQIFHTDTYTVEAFHSIDILTTLSEDLCTFMGSIPDSSLGWT